MRLTTKKLRQIIREEVERATEAFNYGPDGEATPAQQRWRDRERNVGVADSERRAASRAARRGTQITGEEKKAISSLIDQFLAKVNDENSGWWPQTWLGGGRIWTGSDYVDRTPEQNAAMRKQFDDIRASSGRNPFTVDHIKQDIKQSGSSAWYSDPKTRELKHPSLSAFIKSKLVTAIYAALDASSGTEAENKLKAYLKGL
jgi:hypothetical protein